MTFETVLLEDLAAQTKNSIVGGPFGSNLVSKDYVSVGVPVIRGQNMGGRWVGGEFVFVSEEKADSLSPNKARPGDLIFTQRGTLGQVSIVPVTPHSEYIVSQSQMKVTVDPLKVDVNFLYYVFCSPSQLDYINNTAIQTGVPHTNLGILKKTPIQLPSLKEQQQIASILSSLDDRISLLRETNATLEAIAQALFKSWFVDFDPVRAKMEGRAPEGMDEATAALFPDGFEESALGLVPRGWRCGELGDVLVLRNQRTQPSEITKALSYVPIESIGAKTPFLAESKSGEEANSSLTIFEEGDILFGAMRPYFHKVCIAPFEGVTRTTVFTLTARNPLARAFGLFMTYQDSTIEYATQHSEGSTIPYAKWKNSLEKMPVLLPSDSVQERFSETVDAAIARANTNNQQAKSLAALRDTLLPRLISGQLRLPEAEALAA